MAEKPWYSDDPTAPQMRALQALRNTATGGAYAGNLRRFATLGTLRAMHRLGMIRADADTIQRGVYVSLTEHGRACSEDAATLDGEALAKEGKPHE